MCVKKKRNRGKFPCERARVCINKKIFKHYRIRFLIRTKLQVLFVSICSSLFILRVSNRWDVFVMLLAVSRDKHLSRAIKSHQKKKNRESFTEKKVTYHTLTGKHEYKMYFKTSSCKTDECFTCIEMFPFNPIKTYKIL